MSGGEKESLVHNLAELTAAARLTLASIYLQAQGETQANAFVRVMQTLQQFVDVMDDPFWEDKVDALKGPPPR